MSEERVRFPAMRREVMAALAALSDVEYQREVWVKRNVPRQNYCDDLTQNITTLFDDCQVLPDPKKRIRDILLAGDELRHLAKLGAVLGVLVKELGDKPDSTYLEHAQWAYSHRTRFSVAGGSCRGRWIRCPLVIGVRHEAAQLARVHGVTPKMSRHYVLGG